MCDLNVLYSMFLTLLQNEFAAEGVHKDNAHKTEGKKLMQHECITKRKIFSFPFIIRAFLLSASEVKRCGLTQAFSV